MGPKAILWTFQSARQNITSPWDFFSDRPADA